MASGPKPKQNSGTLPVGRPVGRPKVPESALTRDLRAALVAKATETGRTLAEELTEVAYSEDKRTKLPAIRTIYDILLPVEQEEAREEEELPAVPNTHAGLPERQPDPAKVGPFIPARE